LSRTLATGDRLGRATRAALADALKLPFSKLDEDSREHPAHWGGYVQALFAHGDDLFAVPLAELVAAG
jgi:hypothetical protein